MINEYSKYSWNNIKYDLPASLVVFLVALPLCLGIALASGAPLFSGIIAGIVGGIVVGSVSGSSLSVSGPAAGLTVIVFSAIEELGSFEVFTMAVVIAGIIQIMLGFMKAGIIGHFFPVSVIKGMLAAIGLILILKQIPHAFGYDEEFLGTVSFRQFDGHNTFSELYYALLNIEPAALVISLFSLAILILWEQPFMKNKTIFNIIPGPLVVVILAILFNLGFMLFKPEIALDGTHLVNLPVSENIFQFIQQFSLPDFSSITDSQVWIVAFTIAIVASLESLLSLDATDKMDPYKRVAPTNLELKAQGLGNVVSGMIGGLPLTAVIVRSTANVSAGGRTKVSAILHGFLLLLSALFIPFYLNMIPLASLAAILLLVGYKLNKPSLYISSWQKGMNQFIPFVVTIVAILFTDLLIGITIGMLVGLYFVIKTNFHLNIFISNDNNNYLIKLNKDVSFLNKAFLRRSLSKIPEGSFVIIDGSKAVFIDEDIVETINDFVKTAPLKKITVELKKTNSSSNTIFRKSLAS
jgi:MFS superfamily sulfate permease-like transporter